MTQELVKETIVSFEDIAAPSGQIGNQDGNSRNLILDYVTPTQYEIEQARRKNKDEAAQLYCIVFPAVPQKIGKVGKLLRKKIKTQEETDQQRMEIIRALWAAGFMTELVYSSSKEEIMCKISATDDRLLTEADLREYKLELNSLAVQHIAELKINEIKLNTEVSIAVTCKGCIKCSVEFNFNS